MKQLHARAGQSVNATKWFELFGFDVMTDIAFGTSMEMIKSGKVHPALGMLQGSLRVTGAIGAAPWLFIILKELPGFGAATRVFLRWCAEKVMLRVKV